MDVTRDNTRIPTSDEEEEVVTVDELSASPSQAYRVYYATDGAKRRGFMRAVNVTPHGAKPRGHTRFVCVSDTHGLTDGLRVPPGDILLHSGDFTRIGLPREVAEFNAWLGRQPCRYKVVIAGNRELSFDEELMARLGDPARATVVPPEVARALGGWATPAHVRSLLTNCVYLQDSETQILGFRIYGSPWQPRHSSLAFNLPRGRRLLDKWDLIPSGVDVLMTHGPPLGAGDAVRAAERAGCVELLNTVRRRVRPRMHVFGHIHEGYGMMTDGRTRFVNASTCNVHYKPVNPPIVIDLPNPWCCLADIESTR